MAKNIIKDKFIKKIHQGIKGNPDIEALDPERGDGNWYYLSPDSSYAKHLEDEAKTRRSGNSTAYDALSREFVSKTAAPSRILAISSAARCSYEFFTRNEENTLTVNVVSKGNVKKDVNIDKGIEFERLLGIRDSKGNCNSGAFAHYSLRFTSSSYKEVYVDSECMEVFNPQKFAFEDTINNEAYKDSTLRECLDEIYEAICFDDNGDFKKPYFPFVKFVKQIYGLDSFKDRGIPSLLLYAFFVPSDMGEFRAIFDAIEDDLRLASKIAEKYLHLNNKKIDIGFIEVPVEF